MKLHEDRKLFRQALQYTADQLQIAPIFIEKDYWVTYALQAIFSHPIGGETVFKGGTALSNCFKIIDRFSEDIDLVVLKREGESSSKLTGKIKTVGEAVSKYLPEIQVENVTHKMGMNRKTAHTYNKEFTGEYGQVRDVIIIEATWLGYFEPYTVKSINSFVGDMMLATGQEKLAQEHGIVPFDVRVLEPIRTLCEKIMSLVRFSYSDDPIDNLKKKIRHTYDIHQLLRQDEFAQFFSSKEFDVMLLKVAADDRLSYKSNNKWLDHHPNEALIFESLEEIWKQLTDVYNNDFRKLVYGGKFPESASVLESLRTVRERLTQVIWK